jgi:hypothetical protein
MVSSNTSLVPNMNPEFCLMIGDQAPGCPDVFYKKGSWAAWLLGIPTPHGGLYVNSLWSSRKASKWFQENDKPFFL